jgi:hypothetical protein
MAKNQMSELTEKGFEQAHKAMNDYFESVQNDMWGDTELSRKLMRYTEQNISAVGEHVQKLGRAKDFQGLVKMQTEFMQSQFEIFMMQAKEISDVSLKMATNSGTTPLWKLLS